MHNTKKPNIVILVWDAVRAKNLPFYGYHRNTTPFLQSIEKDFAIYQNAISSSYWTLPSITSLFTGMYTSRHGLLVDNDTIDPSIDLLACILGEEGYSCGAFNRNPYVSDYTGLDTGFHEYVSDAKCVWDYLKKFEQKVKKRFSTDPRFVSEKDDSLFTDTFQNRMFNAMKHMPDTLADSGSGRMARLFSKWIRQKKAQNKPIFAFFQSIETHSPYRAPLLYSLKYLSLHGLYRKMFINQNHMSYLLGRTAMTESDFGILRCAYDNSILYSDEITRRIIQTLKNENLYDDTLLIVMADHGESIGEHNLMFHVWSLYDDLIKVPLFIKYPKDVGITGTISKIVQNVDILPTILALLGKHNHRVCARLQGNSLVDTSIANRDPDIAVSELIKAFGPDKIAYRSKLTQYDRRLLSLRTASEKIIYSSRGDHEFYDLLNDPEELKNLFGQAESKCTEFEVKVLHYYREMDAFYQKNSSHIEGETTVEIEDEIIKEKLSQLGYL